ncbi:MULTISPECIES: AraC family transcriptional regulator [unclassified Flavobacterium]|jgi:AraC-like DNA-binding protein|uniref:AraC family transcriptional regulator n=1 Tax=unclassified Flavobacterium TaxID=196869 RepID=UPI0012A92688|nr:MULTISPECIES: AraC family transcriptional regulator [unclassified Flavobacterium]MBF4483746.1 helix-turn-helix domain-containing protein [Flavobacterium sp. CSZ]QGK76139.1 helix-turn-helix domain-containing protein [Flavobacterium sp. SLB02]
MKLEQTKITSYTNSTVSVLNREESFFQSPFHSHPELELVYVKESFGKRIIGNSVMPFEPGDMVFLGSDLPHVWLNDEMYYQGISTLKANAIVVYFSKDIFGPAFYELKETQKINELFFQAGKGISIIGKTNKQIAKKLEKLLLKKDFEVIIGLFEILSLLSESEDRIYINNEAYSTAHKDAKKDRLSEVFQYVNENYKKDIVLVEIAAIANMTPTSFCRMFRLKTKKSFVEYLNEIRVSKACKFLLETDLSMSEIAYECGYKTASNFNKLFKKFMGMTPSEFKKSAAV